MKQTLIVLICVLMMALQMTCNQVVSHQSDTVVGNLLAEPYLAVLLSLLGLIATLI